MKHSTVPFAFMATLLLPSVAFAQELSFQSKAVKVGQRTQREDTLLMKNKLTVIENGKVIREGQQVESEAFLSEQTVLAMDGDKVTKLKVVVKKKEFRSGVGKSEVRKADEHGKSYILELKDGKTVVTENGQTVSGKSAALLIERHSLDLGIQNKAFQGALGKSKVKMGETIKVSQDGLKYLHWNKKLAPMKASATTLTLSSTKTVGGEKLAVFDVEVIFSGNGRGIDAHYKLKGKVEVSLADSRIRSIQVSGPGTLSGKRPGSELVGKGTMELSYKAEQGAKKSAPSSQPAKK